MSFYDRDPRVKCPRCGSLFITITGADYENGTLRLKCINCNYEFEVTYDAWL